MSGLTELGSGGGSRVESIKLGSSLLRGEIAESLAEDGPFAESDTQLLKFHGTYQQEERDKRQASRAAGQEKTYRFMLRTRIPGGVLTSAQYLAQDDIAGRYANGTLRVTTRQGLQFHGVLKGDLKATIRAIDSALLTTLAACGDVNRNVMACPAPVPSEARRHVQAVASQIATHLAPRSRAYHDIWIDGERIEKAKSPAESEPIYGPTYLPRKFKIAVGLPEDNCVDILSNDVGLVAHTEEDRIAGFTIVVGGGMGRTHGKSETYPRLATPLAFIEPQDALAVVEAIVTVQRDYGDRENRRHARFKYLVEERGAAWVRAEVERRVGHELALPRPLDIRRVDDHLGWHLADDGTWFLGIFVENGRIVDRDTVRLRTGLRRLVERYADGVRFTGQQNVLLTGIVERRAVEAELEAHGIVADPMLIDVRRDAMACPALPTCGLALTDAERALPSVMDRVAEAMNALGIADRRVSVRMTGCPNGCARPYMGDIGIVGRSKDLYDLFVGGDCANSRMNWLLHPAVRIENLSGTIATLLRAWRDDGDQGDFGDWCDRLGREELLNRTQHIAS
jgi:sulfite reductase (ferredoxin)